MVGWGCGQVQRRGTVGRGGGRDPMVGGGGGQVDTGDCQPSTMSLLGGPQWGPRKYPLNEPFKN
jgi:hypothetical protein